MFICKQTVHFVSVKKIDMRGEDQKITVMMGAIINVQNLLFIVNKIDALFITRANELRLRLIEPMNFVWGNDKSQWTSFEAHCS